MSADLRKEIERRIEDNDFAIENENRMFSEVEIDKARRDNAFLQRVLAAITDAEERGRLKGLEEAAMAIDIIRSDWRSPEMKAWAESRKSAVAEIRALAGKTEKEPTP